MSFSLVNLLTGSDPGFIWRHIHYRPHDGIENETSWVPCQTSGKKIIDFKEVQFNAVFFGLVNYSYSIRKTYPSCPFNVVIFKKVITLGNLDFRFRALPFRNKEARRVDPR